jgi:hypothetical protein
VATDRGSVRMIVKYPPFAGVHRSYSP